MTNPAVPPIRNLIELGVLSGAFGAAGAAGVPDVVADEDVVLIGLVFWKDCQNIKKE